MIAMAQQQTKLQVFLASPSDVKAERDRLGAVCDELNSTIAAERDLCLEIVRWETHTWPGLAAMLKTS
jgi:hypothetical protein